MAETNKTDDKSKNEDFCTSSSKVTLFDGSILDISKMTTDQLLMLQWNEEQKFAKKIIGSPKGSQARSQITRQGYDTICKIMAAMNCRDTSQLVMGYRSRWGNLVLKLLAKQRAGGIQKPKFFEIGCGSGALLKIVADAGYQVAGLEVADSMHQQAKDLLGSQHESNLILGSFMSCNIDKELSTKFNLVYWNDVFEHIPPDEILEYLKKIHDILSPGGALVTITPNWHSRPYDITKHFCPPRTEARGFHLKEYTLNEVNNLLRKAGFTHISTPLAVSQNHAFLNGKGLLSLKIIFESFLEYMPFKIAKMFCHGLGLNASIATKS